MTLSAYVTVLFGVCWNRTFQRVCWCPLPALRAPALGQRPFVQPLFRLFRFGTRGAGAKWVGKPRAWGGSPWGGESVLPNASSGGANGGGRPPRRRQFRWELRSRGG